MAYRLQRDVAKELGIDQNELRFLIQWLVGESSFACRPRVRYMSHTAGQTRLVDDILYERLKEVVPIFIMGRSIYRDAPAEIAKGEGVE